MTVRIGLSFGDATDPRRPPGMGRSLGIFNAFGEDRGKQLSRAITIGYLRYRRTDVEALANAGTKLRVTVVGWLRVDPVSPALAAAVFDRVRVIGVRPKWLRAPSPASTKPQDA